MGVLQDIYTLPARKAASDATRKNIFRVLQSYLEEVKSYGDELDIDNFYDDFVAYYKRNWMNPEIAGELK